MNIVVQVALTTESSNLSFPDLARCSAAMQKQVTRDFGPIWGIRATVDAFERLEQVPLGYWPVIVLDDIQNDGALGFHTDDNGQPYALVKLLDGWETTVSHEVLEMLADPFGNRVVSCPSLKEDQGRVQYLVEVCDPSEAPEYGYSVNGTLVSDFYTPVYFDPVSPHEEEEPQRVPKRYSFTGAITRPREVLPGGYISWFDPVGHHVWQQRYFGPEPEFLDLGEFEVGAGSLREQVDRRTITAQATKGIPQNTRSMVTAREARDKIDTSSAAWAETLRSQIQAL